MTSQLHSTNSISLRPPQQVMKLDRLGSFHQTRLSFMRAVMRRLKRDNWTFECPIWRINEQGEGVAVYVAKGPERSYSMVCFAHDLDPAKRSDRVIAEAWDTTFALYDGVIGEDDIERLSQNVPKQEAGRCLESELVLSRANKSVRLFEYVVSELAAGRQPDQTELNKVGYLMRTTAVYGNGKFGIADRTRIQSRPGLSGPFQAEMLTVWLIRNFTHDLVEHVAQAMAPEKAVKLNKRLKRHLGIGNSTGLGMAPFLVSHPILLNNWMMVRETALARVCAIEKASKASVERTVQLIKRVSAHLEQWKVPDTQQADRVSILKQEWQELTALCSPEFLEDLSPFSRLIEASGQWSLEAQELVVALVLEPHGELVDGLTDCMASDLSPRLDPAMSVAGLEEIINESYQWALDLAVDKPANCKQFWYVSEEKLEPRLGDRFDEAGAELELPHDIARQVQALCADIAKFDRQKCTAEFLMRFPQHRHIVRRIQTVAKFPYAEIRDNLVGEKCLPIDMLRCKLSFFGASKFDPKSDRWTRITMFQGAALPDDILDTSKDADDWWLPVLETA
ncbi:hypothetical protein [uncultured Kiloniella sp.]|uniref:hypothetical protein n=1 Tax=uncultured Kiloniella sp. TaxID=1133091 RepID=UPI00260E6935|nr:hypothetical protein [uncultured Kiloniella sp.]